MKCQKILKIALYLSLFFSLYFRREKIADLSSLCGKFINLHMIEKFMIDRRKNTLLSLYQEANENLPHFVLPEIRKHSLCPCPQLQRLSQNDSDYLIIEYCKIVQDLRIVTVYPLAKKYNNKILTVLDEYGSIVYRKSIPVNRVMIKNLIWLFYLNEKHFLYLLFVSN